VPSSKNSASKLTRMPPWSHLKAAFQGRGQNSRSGRLWQSFEGILDISILASLNHEIIGDAHHSFIVHDLNPERYYPEKYTKLEDPGIG
jgi:hypothetical protein